MEGREEVEKEAVDDYKEMMASEITVVHMNSLHLE